MLAAITEFHQLEMNFKFVTGLPLDFQQDPIMISPPNSFEHGRVEYLLIENDGEPIKAFEIRFEYHCSPFKEALVVNDLLAVGHEAYFYLFDLATKTDLLTIQMDWYFGHLYFNDDLFFIASARSLYAVNQKGKLLWKNSNLGIDGVIIEKFIDSKIYGSGEWDPPGGWRDFILDAKTGKSLPTNGS